MPMEELYSGSFCYTQFHKYVSKLCPSELEIGTLNTDGIGTGLECGKKEPEEVVGKNNNPGVG